MEANEILEISTSLASGALTLFLGTGFSKHMTDDNAPSWLELLYECAEKLNDDDLINSLFVTNDEGVVSKCNFQLTICAQILEEEFTKNSKDIREEIATIIEEKINIHTINPDHIREFRKFLESHNDINIITTNYDSIITDFILPQASKTVVEGTILPKTLDIKPVLHIHGSIKKPNSIILTEADYFNFSHNESYMSRKLFTSIQENTIVIIGYSLGDFDLNRILNEAKELKLDNTKRSDIYYVSRDAVNDIYQRYYYSTFGVTVLEETEISDLFQRIEGSYHEAEKIIEYSKRLHEVFENKVGFTDDFIKLSDSLYKILLWADVGGHSLRDESLQRLIIDFLHQKKKKTLEPHAWNQYAHLADWLIYLGSIIDIAETSIEDEYLELVKYSFSKMSKITERGYSWKAHSIWFQNFIKLKSSNKTLIHKMKEESFFRESNSVEEIIN
ncbi:SIR2-like domain-containing protein [Amphibacillus marinus]|uniref:SIR2-like domain-containing protein n=1 Tax=Amphibacillus marinus TaxID=872970 RepID=A0A1H8SQH2_9BACI|nr:SIR2 family protein [Amphibacillus marinus]SEO81030.1 SIR2-like domain-containing protein [Amphibacillus marinus]